MPGGGEGGYQNTGRSLRVMEGRGMPTCEEKGGRS
jgi:hypothetical protein